ncbi:hypothetical protein ABEW48_08505, partial [Paenibacillus favisporus]
RGARRGRRQRAQPAGSRSGASGFGGVPPGGFAFAAARGANSPAARGRAGQGGCGAKPAAAGGRAVRSDGPPAGRAQAELALGLAASMTVRRKLNSRTRPDNRTAGTTALHLQPEFTLGWPASTVCPRSVHTSKFRAGAASIDTGAILWRGSTPNLLKSKNPLEAGGLRPTSECHSKGFFFI